MLELSHCFEQWVRAGSELESGHSVIFYSPRNYEDRRFAEEVLKRFKRNTEADLVHLYIDHHVTGGKLDYGRLWETTSRQAGVKSRKIVDGRDSYDRALRRAIEAADQPILFFVSSSGPGFETHQYDLISMLHQIRQELDLEPGRRLLFLNLDNYPLYYYESTRIEHSSCWNVTRLHHWPLDQRELVQLLRREELSRWIDPNTVEQAAESVFRLTGGHVGLVLDLLDHTSLRPSPLPAEFWYDECAQILKHSTVLEDIRRFLSEDPVGLTEVALGYATRRYPLDGSPNVQFLRQIGVIHWNSALRAELCPGLISELVYDLRDSTTASKPVGTLVSEFGPRLYDSRSEKVLADDADFVVLHLSDLHAGPLYPFRLPSAVSGRQEYGKKSLAQMIGADLQSLSLRGKVDLVILSGDFTEVANMDEFRRAREIIREVLQEVGVGTDRLAITAGNHDVEWSQTALSQAQPVNRGSLENYETFRELLFLPETPVDLRTIKSRSGKALLRIFSLDSNFVEGPKAAGVGFVSEDAFVKAEELLRTEAKNREDQFEVVRTWIVVHHHVFPASSLTIEDIQRPKLTVLANSSDVLAFCGRIGAELILHGHEHQPSVTVARRWPSDAGLDFQPIVAVGAGSISAARSDLGPFSRNQYFILYRKRDHIVVRSRAIGDNGLTFASHNDLAVPLFVSKSAAGAD